MKRKWLLTLLVLLVVSAVILSEAKDLTDGNDSAEAAITAVLTAQADAWNRSDVESYMAGYWKSEKLLFVSSSGVTRGWQATLERYRQRYPNPAAMGKLVFSELEITMLGSDAALVLGRWQLRRERDSKPEMLGGHFTLTLRKFPKEGWRIIADHTSQAQN
jgi:beta-aspartyl-peptidase (threonine type)